MLFRSQHDLGLGATMFIQQKMTPAPGDPTQAKIMLLMPVVFTFMFLNFPSGLVVYWLVNNIISIASNGGCFVKNPDPSHHRASLSPSGRPGSAIKERV